MNWNPAILPDYQQGKYSALRDYYEQQIEEFPTETNYYWYLGLAHLLNQSPEEAQAVWLYIFGQGEDSEIEQWQQELIEILTQEQQRQQQQGQIHLALLIAEQIRELEPNNFNNLLRLCQLAIELGEYNPSTLAELGLTDSLTQTKEVDPELLWQVLEQILAIPSADNLPLLSAAWTYTPPGKDCLKLVHRLAGKIGLEHGRIAYAIDLVKACLQQKPGDLYLLKTLFGLYSTGGLIKESLEIAAEFYRHCQTTTLKAFGHYQILYCYLSQGNWSQIRAITPKHLQLLKQVIAENPSTLEFIIKEPFPIIAQPLAYIQDNPQENRYLQNEISRIFHNSLELITPSFVPRPSSQPLKIGYIGSTFRKHSVGWLCRWLIRYHDREKFEIYLYLINQNEDELTKTWFWQEVNHPRRLGMNTETIAAQISSDGIDILVDLDSLTNNITNYVMAMKPAPVQLTWLGSDASGLPTIDYFIADNYVLPEKAQNYYQETIWRLPQTYLAIDGFEVGVPSLTREDLAIPPDAVVYLNQQNSLKYNPHGLGLQMQILQAVPDSYLLIKGLGDQQIIQESITKMAIASELDPNRLRFLPRDRDELTHRANLTIADVVLDTYPYNGATTTLEVLWMGIPLVTRVGEQFAARNSYTFMRNVGLTAGIAWTDQEYIDWAIKLGTNPELRKQIYWQLQQAKRTSPLWDGKQFTREMEEAYQQMWRLKGPSL